MTNLNMLPERVSHVTVQDRDVYIIGTAHLSKESVEDVRSTIEKISPDTICVELCESRYKALTQRDNWEKTNIFKIIREKKAVFLLAQLLMSSFYRKLGEKLGIQPGAEMIEAIKLAKATNAQLVLADREIEITLKRVWGNLTFSNKFKLIIHIAASIFTKEEIDSSLIETLKEKDQLESVLAEFTEKFPQIKKRLIDERDIYLAQNIRLATGKKIVAVVGAGHVNGITKHIDKEESLDELVQMPPRSLWPTLFKWAVPAAIIAVITYGFFKQGAAHSIENIYIWILVNGVLSALGAALALAHPVTILSAFLAAPLTSLNPTIAAGWVAGIVQAWIKKPTVTDFENLPNAISTFKGFWTNPVTKILLIVALANLGSVFGTYIAGIWIAARSV
jgi:pheromone shutdown-related protein TraB